MSTQSATDSYDITYIIIVIFILLAFEDCVTWQLRIALTVCSQTGETGRGSSPLKKRQMSVCVVAHARMACHV